MYNFANRQNNHSNQPLDRDERLISLVKQYTRLSDSDIEILIEVNHTLPYLSKLEGGDAYIDILTKDNHLAIVVGQDSPPEGNFHELNIVGDVMWRENEPGVYRTLELGVTSRELKAVVRSERIIVKQNAAAITNGAGEILGALIVEKNLNSSSADNQPVNAEQPVKQEATIYSGKEMHDIAEHMNDAMIRFDPSGISVYANPQAKRLFLALGYKDDVLGMRFENLDLINCEFQEIVDRRSIESTEVRAGKFVFDVTYTTIWDQDIFLGVVLIIKDTTDIKSAEKELILKSTVIDEIHHRVKNNLQMIISLIGLQSMRSNSSQVKRFADEIVSRIHSMSVTHEILAYSGVDSVDIKELLGKMIVSSKSYIVPETSNIEFLLTGDSILLQSNTATTIAMVVNELIQNAIKHAFVDRSEGTIWVDIIKGEVFCKILISDNGIGFKNQQTGASMGLKLVNSLVKDKLKGDITFRGGKNGTEVCFTFICKENQ